MMSSGNAGKRPASGGGHGIDRLSRRVFVEKASWQELADYADSLHCDPANSSHKGAENYRNLAILDFTDAIISDRSFSRCTFNKSWFRNAKLCNVEFIGCELVAADFTGALLEGVTFKSCTLERSVFTRASLSDCRFSGEGYSIRQADFARAALDSVCFDSGGDLSESSFELAEFKDVTLSCKTAENVNFRGIKANGVQFGKCGDEAGENISLLRMDGSDFSDAVFVVNPERLDEEPPTFVFDCVSLVGASLRRIRLTVPKDVSKPIPFIYGGDFSDTDFDAAILKHCLMRSHATTGGSSLRFTGASFTRSKLQHARLENLELVASAFTDSDLSHANVVMCDLTSSNLERIRACELEMEHCNGTSVTFDFSWMQDCAFIKRDKKDGASFQFASFKGVELIGCEFTDVDLSGAVFNSAVFNNVLFSGEVVCEKADFTELKLETGWSIDGDCVFDEADFSKSELQGIDFDACRGRAAKFEGATLSGANFNGCDFAWAVFCGADITGATFRDGCFKGASFAKAYTSDGDQAGKKTTSANKKTTHVCFNDSDLSVAVFDYTQISYADFSDVNLSMASFSGSVLRGCTWLKATVTRTRFDFAMFGTHAEEKQGVELKGLITSGANFQGAVFDDCVMSNVSFQDANLSASSFKGCKLHEDISFSGASMEGVSGFAQISWKDQCQDGPIDFSDAYISATNIPTIPQGSDQNDSGEKSQWGSFLKRLEYSGHGESERKNFLAWKNNCGSLGLYEEQSELFRREQLTKVLFYEFHRCPGWLIALVLGVVVAILICVVAGLFGGVSDEIKVGPVFVLLGGLLPVPLVAVWVYREGFLMSAMDAVYGFGERPLNVMWFSLSTVFFSAVGFILAGRYAASNGFFDALLVSLHAFTTLGLPSGKVSVFLRTATGLEAFIGVVSAALLIHAMARRFAGR